MPELPEIRNLALQMEGELVGRIVERVEVLQAKCLNVPTEEFRSLIEGHTVLGVTSRGKWLFIRLDPDSVFLLSLGMGGDIRIHDPEDQPPGKYQVRLDFRDGRFLSIAFWWFGYAHAVSADRLHEHKMTAFLGPDPLNPDEFAFHSFDALLGKRKVGIKSLLMDQKSVAGIGNVYIQDILFRAGLHPNRKAEDISDETRVLLYQAIVENLASAAELGGLAYERDLYGREGRLREFLVGYREGRPCPSCGQPILKIRTGSTASFICPKCQT